MRYVGFIRNVMVGREGLHRQVLLRLLAEAGAADGSSHLATGNVIFDASPSRLDATVRRFEAGIEGVIGRREPVIVRTAEWLRAFVAADPFAGHPADEWERVVVFVPQNAPPLDAARLRSGDGLTVIAVWEHEFLAAARHGVRRPGALRVLEESGLARGTSRSWSTVERLARLA